MRRALVLTLLLPAAGAGAHLACSNPVEEAPRAFDAGRPRVDSGSTPDDVPVEEVDAAEPLDAGSEIVLYAFVARKLVMLHPVTGALTEIATTTTDNLRMAWDDRANAMRVIVNPRTPGPGPSLGTINLCTGFIAAGPRLVGPDDVPVLEAEGLAVHPPTRTTYICFRSADSPEHYSNTLASVDVDTGRIRPVGTLATRTKDCDSLTFGKTTLYALDLGTDASTLYDVVMETAVVTAGPRIAPATRVTYDQSRSVLFGVDAFKRRVMEIDLRTGAPKNIGSTHDAAVFAGTDYNAVAAAPRATCP